ncbi:tyrosine-protein phosphatase [Rhizobium sp. GCM10022189]|uniref:tyrosine-protein phosphatase n=1 Tax=Rhizobium sp. GCM10022189 TaxID=3252654 RepID=UPI003623BEF2
MQTYERVIALDGAHNVRDLGGYATGAGGLTRWRSLLRGDALHGLSAADIEALVAQDVTTVIDLRNGHEIALQPNRLEGDARVVYANIPLFAALAPIDMGAADAAGFDMGERYCQALDSCQPAIAEVLATIARAPDGIALFHCTAGKDRTGLIAALILANAGVDDAVIIEDYALTGSVSGPLLGQLRARALTRGASAAFVDTVLASAPESMARALHHLASRYGGAGSYMAQIGMSRRDVRDLERRLAG